MKILRFVLINIVVLFLLLAIFSALMPSRVRISRATDINLQAELVSAKIGRIREWGEWNEFVKQLSGPHVAADTLSSLQLKIILLKRSLDTLTTKWEQQNGKIFKGVFTLAGNGNATTVQWYFDFTFRWYPWEKFSSMVYDQQLGPQMEQSLSNLKRLLEKAP